MTITSQCSPSIVRWTTSLKLPSSTQSKSNSVTVKPVVEALTPEALTPEALAVESTVVESNPASWLMIDQLYDMFGVKIEIRKCMVDRNTKRQVTPLSSNPMPYGTMLSKLRVKYDLSMVPQVAPVEDDRAKLTINDPSSVSEIIASINPDRIRDGYSSRKCSTYSLAELQSFCKRLEIQATGNKSVVIARLRSYISRYRESENQ